MRLLNITQAAVKCEAGNRLGASHLLHLCAYANAQHVVLGLLAMHFSCTVHTVCVSYVAWLFAEEGEEAEEEVGQDTDDEEEMDEDDYYKVCASGIPPRRSVCAQLWLRVCVCACVCALVCVFVCVCVCWS